MKHSSGFVALAAAVLVSVTIAPVGAQAPDPLVGTWKLNVAKSMYSPGPAPQSSTVVIGTAGTGISVAVDSIGPDGKPIKWSYTSTADGKDSPVMGNPAFDMVSATRTTPSAGSTTYKKAGKTVSTLSTTVSDDGKLLTVTTTGTDVQGRMINNVAQYDRQ